jgi:hypothetical protein
MNLISPRVHGVIDYSVAILLLLAPWLFGFYDGSIVATAVTIAFGGAAVAYSLLTDYPLGAFRVLPMSGHLAIDVGWALLLIFSPLLFGFADVVRWPHVVVGVMGLVVTALTRREERQRTHHPGRLRTT